MAAHGKWRGHAMTFDEETDAWLYDSDGVAVSEDPHRRCGKCNLPTTPEGHDPCLGALPGVTNACCGHGEPGDAYVQYEDGTVARGGR